MTLTETTRPYMDKLVMFGAMSATEILRGNCGASDSIENINAYARVFESVERVKIHLIGPFFVHRTANGLVSKAGEITNF